MKIIAWNVNGIGASLDKGLLDFIKNEGADVYMFQETKTAPERVDSKLTDVDGYHDYWSSAEKKGYSGVVSYCKDAPNDTTKGIGVTKFDSEGRVLTHEYDEFYLLNVYFVNAGRDLKRLDDKKYFNDEFLSYCNQLHEEKPVIIGGDFNVSHKEKDLANPDSNKHPAGFTPEEGEWFSKLINEGYVDTFREFDDDGGKYTYWSYMYNAREKNIGWRLDYFVVSDDIIKKVEASYRLPDVMGSDHCPIGLNIEF